MSKVLSPQSIAASLPDLWSPQVIGEVDNNYIKVAKVQGSFCWHTHDNEDELFYVLKGKLVIEIEVDDETVESVTLNEGDIYVVPKGVRHNPVADEECHLLVFEKKETLHTGEVQNEKTRTISEQLTGS